MSLPDDRPTEAEATAAFWKRTSAEYYEAHKDDVPPDPHKAHKSMETAVLASTCTECLGKRLRWMAASLDPHIRRGGEQWLVRYAEWFE
jgi:hypothetical protein